MTITPPPPPPPPVRAGGREGHGPPAGLQLRPLGEADLGFAYQLAAEVGPGWHRLCREGLPPPPYFPQALFEGVVTQFVGFEDGRPFGICSFTDWSPRHEVVWFDAPCVADIDPRVAGAFVAACIESVAGELPFARAFTQYPSFARPPIDHLPAGFDGPVEEGRLTRALFHDNFYWDVVISGVTRRGLAT